MQDFVEYHGECYRFLGGSFLLDPARQICWAMGSHLPDFSSYPEWLGFKQAISEHSNVFWGLVKPKVLIHLLVDAEGGYTEVELRFFREAAIEAGSGFTLLLDNKFGPQVDGELLKLN